jgi:hypothetical protein
MNSPSAQAPDAGFEVQRPDSGVAEFPADGVLSVIIRRGVAKIEFYQFIGINPENRKEQRRVSHRIAIPLAGLEELSQILRRMGEAARSAGQPAPSGEPIRLID